MSARSWCATKLAAEDAETRDSGNGGYPAAMEIEVQFESMFLDNFWLADNFTREFMEGNAFP